MPLALKGYLCSGAALMQFGCEVDHDCFHYVWIYNFECFMTFFKSEERNSLKFFNIIMKHKIGNL